MKVAVVSNINGNLYVLKNVLSEIDKEPEINHVINLGNFTYGPHCAEVFDCVISDSRFINLLGDSERDILEEVSGNVYAGNEWLIEQMGQERLERLREMQETLETELFSHSLLILGATGSPLFRGLPEECSPFVKLMKYERRKELTFDNFFQYSMVFSSGDTPHMSQFRHPLEQQEVLLVCPGTACGSGQPWGTFAVVDLNTSIPAVSFKNVAFDLEPFIKELYEGKHPLKESFVTVHTLGNVQSYFEENPQYHCYLPKEGAVHLEFLKLLEEDSSKYVIDVPFLTWLMELHLEVCKSVRLGFWGAEEQQVREALKSVKNGQLKTYNQENDTEITIDLNEFSTYKTQQICVCGELNLETRDYIRSELQQSAEGTVWFDINLYQESSQEDPDFSASHHGKEIHIRYVNPKNLEHMRTIKPEYTMSHVYEDEDCAI